MDINELVDALKKSLPKGDPRPERFRILLQKIPVFHRTLYEWKELHNYLDEILSAFQPFSAEVQRADSDNKVPYPRELRNLWRPVSVKVDSLIIFAQQIEYIGERFYIQSDQTVGERWAVKINELRNNINEQIGLDEGARFNVSAPKGITLLARSKILIGFKPSWWIALYELTNAFNHIAYGQMHLADKKLRETATDLYHLSNEILGS